MLYLPSYPLYVILHPLYLCHQTQCISYNTSSLWMTSQTLYVWHHIQYAWPNMNPLWHHTPICMIPHQLYLWHHIHYIWYHPCCFHDNSTTFHPLYLTSQPLYLCLHTDDTHICIDVLLNWRHHSKYGSHYTLKCMTTYTFYMTSHSHFMTPVISFHDITTTAFMTSDLLYMKSHPQFMTSNPLYLRHHSHYVCNITPNMVVNSYPPYLISNTPF